MMAKDNQTEPATTERTSPGMRDRIRTQLGRRRWIVPVGAAVAMFALTFVLPWYVATQPRFMARFPNTQKYHATWADSTHAEITCQSCHVPPSIISQTRFNLMMLKEFYLSIVVPGLKTATLSKPTNAACEQCHYAIRTVSPSGDLKIPHRAHVAVLRLKCVFCHKYAVHFKNPEGTHTPRMATCLKCHDGKKAKNACGTCHKRKSFPLNHRKPSWLVIHPKMRAKIDCRRCHGWTRRWCRECHSRQPRSHEGLWRSLHRYKVAVRRNCEACHKGRFCVRCHGEVPALNLKSAPKYVE